MKIYLDESMNAGSNALDKNQKVYTLSGIGVDEKNELKISDEINSIKKRYKINTELKCAALYKQKKFKAIKDILKLINDYSSTIFLSILEYRFSICMRIVEQIFDPFYNEILDNSFSQDTFGKQLFASFAYKFPDGILSDYFNAFIEEDVENMGKVIEKMANQKIIFDKSDRKSFVEGYKYKKITYDNNINELIDNYLEIFYLGLNNIKHSPEKTIINFIEKEDGEKTFLTKALNVPVLVALILKINSFSEEESFKEHELIHDVNDFQAIYEYYIKKMRSTETTEVVYGEETAMLGDKFSVKKIIEADSENNGFIQLADILSGTISRFYKDLSLREISRDEMEKQDKKTLEYKTELFICVDYLLYKNSNNKHSMVSYDISNLVILNLTNLCKYLNLDYSSVIQGF